MASSAFLSAVLACLIISFTTTVTAACHYQSPAFPPPDYSEPCPELLEAFGQIEASLSALGTKANLNTSSYSIEVTSSQATLWSAYQTALEKDPKRPGAEQVNGSSAYRIASITKTFTVLGILQQHAAGNLRLDDPVDQYVSDLRRRQSGSIPWKDITLRSLASQLSGIPRDWAQGDLITELPDPTLIGLPPVTFSGLPKCDSFGDYVPCTAEELLESIRTKPPLFAPKQKSTYSNIAFELLGLVLSNVSGVPYEEYIDTAILQPLEMSGTSFSKPRDSVAVLPKNVSWYWDIDEGVQNPTGGLYAPSSDMSKFLRYILTHFNGVTHALNWMHPVSFTAGVNSFYGIPWEMFRTDKILGVSGRAVTFVTKGGGLPAYQTIIMLVPEYELGITILTAGDEDLLDVLRDLVTAPLIRAADKVAQRQVEETYAGTYKAAHLNSSMELIYSENLGLEISTWISNGTNMMAEVITEYFHVPAATFHAQTIPTLLYRDEESRTGEQWRIVVVQSPSREAAASVWDDFCFTDVDTMMYAGRPLNEMVFWDKGADGKYQTLELPAFRISLGRERGDEGEFEFLGGALLTQGGAGREDVEL